MNPQSRIGDLHHDAMRLADEASDLRRRGQDTEASARLRQALEHEQRARRTGRCGPRPRADTFDPAPQRPPTLAWECGEYREAERLITTALSGTPPETIAEELRDLLLQVYFEQSPRKKRRSLAPPHSAEES